MLQEIAPIIMKDKTRMVWVTWKKTREEKKRINVRIKEIGKKRTRKKNCYFLRSRKKKRTDDRKYKQNNNNRKRGTNKGWINMLQEIAPIIMKDKPRMVWVTWKNTREENKRINVSIQSFVKGRAFPKASQTLVTSREIKGFDGRVIKFHCNDKQTTDIYIGSKIGRASCREH